MSISRLGVAVALSLLFASPLAAQGTKVGYVNTDAVMSEYGPAQEAIRQLSATETGFQAEIDKLQADYQQAEVEYLQQQSSMTPQARQNREQQLQSQLVALQNRTQELENQYQQRRSEVLPPIMEDIRSVLEEIRVEGNYGLILDTITNTILVADPALELTQQVLTRLQARSGSEDGT